ncbi:ABC transporter permease subunit [Asanoa siamensis]|uniref:Transporter n=1 Tax=Asanoa siamensis TaxID=926357 RepID=A0ABQ4D4W9_9ACTN|nr:ABC transporter permease subunit [Asanoa siamensis]GIF78572.1 transporter [Asanoa siamensis]
MLWLTWRQHRLQLLAMAAVVAMLAAYLVYRGAALAEPAAVMRACAMGTVTGLPCDKLLDYVGVDSGLNITLAAINLLPALVGAFWGAPLIARELERGTQRLVWGQSVTRRRWLGAKLGGLAVAALLGGAAQAMVVTWAVDQFAVIRTINRFQDPALFDLVGVVPPVLWLFALSLGTVVGLLARRTLPAMAITLAVLVATLFGLNMLRPHYATPETRPLNQAISGTAVYAPQDWLLGIQRRDSRGHAVGDATAERLCPQQWDESCLNSNGITVNRIFHPSTLFWRFQWIEAGILLAGTALLTGFALIRLSRRAD